MHVGALPPGVEAAPPLVFPVLFSPLTGWEIQVLPIAGGLIGLHAGAADGPNEQSGNRQRIVAHELRVQAEAGLPGEFAVVRVALRSSFEHCELCR